MSWQEPAARRNPSQGVSYRRAGDSMQFYEMNGQGAPPNSITGTDRYVSRPVPTARRPGVYTTETGPVSTGMHNHGYDGSSVTDVRVAGNDYSRPARNGYDNQVYSISSVSEPDGFYTVPLPDRNQNTESRYAVYKQDKEERWSKKRICAAVGGSLIGVFIIVAIIILVLVFATDLIRKRGDTVTTTTLIQTLPTSQVTTETSALVQTFSTSLAATTTQAAPILEASDFRGEVRLDQQWSPELQNSSSNLYMNISQEFIQLMDTGMASNPVLSSTYNSTQVLSLKSGSIIVIFRIIFNAPQAQPTILAQVKVAIEKGSAAVAVIAATITVEIFNETTACGEDTLFVCDNLCRKKSEIACDGETDCSDWVDEFRCPGKSVTCTFEQAGDCGYVNDLRASDYKWISTMGARDPGPSADHTYGNASETGHYYYVTPCASRTGCKQGDLAHLMSPVYVGRSDSCLSFYYSMLGHPTQMGPFYLYSYDNMERSRVLWTKDRPSSRTDNAWSQVKITVPTGSYVFTFSSFLRDDVSYGTKAIDDISITPGACAGLPDCGTDGMFCPVTYECVSNSLLCDGNFDCPDGSDEKSCTGYEVKCSFESAGDCNLGFVADAQDSKFIWTVIHGMTPVVTQGTYYDNTYGNEIGQYVFVNPTSSQPGVASRLVTPYLSTGQERCLTFAYNMNDESSQPSQMGILKAYTQINSSSGVIFKDLFNQTSETGRDWSLVRYSIPVSQNPYKIIIEARRGSGVRSVISVDDVTVIQGFCKCSDPSRMQCPDTKCIPKEWICDGMRDCSGGEDEQNCPICTASQYQCRDKSCVNGGSSVVCDRVYDCADGSDEVGCATMAQCNNQNCLNVQFTDGKFYEVCSSSWDQSLNTDICRFTNQGFRGNSSAVIAPSGRPAFLSLSGSASSAGFRNLFTSVSSCSGNTVIKVVCEQETCGRPIPRAASYIIGGSQVTSQGIWPWQVALRYQGLHTCGGSLVNSRWVVSAAHCFSRGSESTPELFQILIGSSERVPGQAGSIIKTAEKIVLHPNYKIDQGGVFGGSDIALVYLGTEVNFTNNILPVCLPDPTDEYTSRSLCYITGWGVYQLQPNQLYPDVLQEAKTKIISRQTCNETSSWNGIISDKMICSGYGSGTIRTCKADSGGPLVCKDKYQRWTLAGITSFGPPGCILEKIVRPDVFTDVPDFIAWIRNITEFVFKCKNGAKIYDSDKLCNAIDDCGDSSDEGVTICPNSVSCTFESRNYCGYSTNSNMWQATNNSASGLGLCNSGPSYDHTSGLADSRHNYMLTSKNGATLTSPVFTGTSTSCLSFFYHISSNNTLLVNAGEVSTLVTGSNSDLWLQRSVNLNTGTYQITFQAIISDSSCIAIDDVTVQAGSCASCPDGSFMCQADLTCIRSWMRCDGVNNCADASDESGCSQQDRIDCSFDTPFACGFQHISPSSFHWQFQYGSFIPDPSTGPPTGRIENNTGTDTAFMVAKAPTEFAVTTVLWPLSLQQAACLTFYYYMYGNQVGVLSVGNNKGQILWEEWGNKGKNWVQVQLNLSPGDQPVFSTQSAGKVANAIAIDDLSVIIGTCPAAAPCNSAQVSCGRGCINKTLLCNKVVDCFDYSDEASCNWSINNDFEQSSGYTVYPSIIGDFTWIVTTGAGSLITKPTRDASNSETGNFLFADATRAAYGSAADYRSPPFLLTSTRCITFSYQIFGAGEGNSVLVMALNETQINHPVTVWSMSVTTNNVWMQALVTLTPGARRIVQLKFQALYGGAALASLSIDNIVMTQGPCTSRACPSDQTLCRNENRCIPKSKLCDGVIDCAGHDDETGCGDASKLLDCDFDSGLCGWTQATSPTDTLDFRLQHGPTVLPDTGPEYDHTQNNLQGYYIYLDSDSSRGGRADLNAATVQLTMPHCLTFFYHMVGENIGVLNVTNRTFPFRPLLNLVGSQEHARWYRVRLNLLPGSISLTFTATSNGPKGNTAIDDITVRPGTCDCTGGFQCPTSRECFETSVECESRNQCIDRQDELQPKCATVCPNADYRCADGECMPLIDVCARADFECIRPNETIDCADSCNLTAEYRCPIGICLPFLTWCNGVDDCRNDNFDEQSGCGQRCYPSQFQCADKMKCIDKRHYCDDEQDCDDGSDERNCTAQPGT